ncbi:hypothetical protein [Clostridium sp. 001]|uniref:hypothetical protein n=1 Tax=Clostridium sp. 001 TaxID=1970093 RepID=UPI001C2C6B9D|nr:hypothetical protein [Clostridium sp. 001]QXE19503.1 hypothetical protein B5S50_12110 [Clostridium sp. 001]
MKKLGLDHNDLFKLAIIKNLGFSSENTSKTIESYKKDLNTDMLEANLTLDREESILKSVACMIEENNKALLFQLEKLGIIPHDEKNL